MRIRHTIVCGHEGCTEHLDRPINVKFALCQKHSQAAQNAWWHLVRRQAARYREVLDLLNVNERQLAYRAARMLADAEVSA